MDEETARDLARLRAGRGAQIDTDPHVARLRRLDAEEPVAEPEPTGPGSRANVGLFVAAIVLACVVAAAGAAMSYGALCLIFGCGA